MTLTAIILTRNESAHIQECIASVAFADSVLVFDSFSSDDTVERARHAGAQVVQRAFDHYANQRNAALENVRADWALFVDADERITPELAAEIQQAVQQPHYAGWEIPRHNYIFGKLTLWAGWYPDYQLRLLRVGQARYDPLREVHEVVLLDGAKGTLKNPLLHYNYRDLPHFIDKQRRYSAYEASILYQAGVRPKLRNYVLQPLRQFKWRYLDLQGYRDGWHGLRLSTLMAWYEFKKYLRLRQLWQQT
ncbi:MAG: glycosyltransferase family 2 protein [Chloroflexi bacterium]|nr:glycosyltransferase family 2 protein [Chloroflexota bacterium]